jgi:hypothetical protein
MGLTLCQPAQRRAVLDQKWLSTSRPSFNRAWIFPERPEQVSTGLHSVRKLPSAKQEEDLDGNRPPRPCGCTQINRTDPAGDGVRRRGHCGGMVGGLVGALLGLVSKPHLLLLLMAVFAGSSASGVAGQLPWGAIGEMGRQVAGGLIGGIAWATWLSWGTGRSSMIEHRPRQGFAWALLVVSRAERGMGGGS